MHLKGLDLNLLIALDVLLEERSVSRAAERLYLSQPAASAALARLRDFFKDELLVLHGKRMIPTAYAESLVPSVKRILSQVDGLISMSTEFIPGDAERLFRIMASDYVTTVFIVPLISVLEQIAPGIQLDLRLPDDHVRSEFERGDHDLMILPEQYLAPSHPSELLIEEQFAVLGWDQNPIFDAPLTPEIYFSSKHVTTALGPERVISFAENQLDSMGESRVIDIYAHSFSTVPWLLVGTNRIAVLHQRLINKFLPLLPLKSVPLPFEFKPMREMMQYHTTRTTDPGVTWLRKQFHKLAQEI